MAIFVITHKKFKRPKDSFYKVLLVGAYKGHIYGDLFDDDGDDSISKKNDNYCELTGIYWVWKNTMDDVVGIVHYRRFFSVNFSGDIIPERIVNKLLNQYDIILPNRVYLRQTLKEQLLNTFTDKEIIILRNSLIKCSPDYKETFDSVMNGHMIYFCNMLITSRKIFSEYCSWLFPILQEMETAIDTKDYNNYQKRIYGFMSERLLTVWVVHNHMNMCEIGMVSTETHDGLIKGLLKGIRRICSYTMPNNHIIDNLFYKIRT